jgi:putative oligomerization/nucleic acid binding protein/phospholipase D-like protein
MDDDDLPLLDLFISMIWFYLFVAWIFFLVMLTLDIFRSRDLSGVQKAVWMVLLIFVPVIAAIAYLIVRGDKMQDRHIRDTQEDAHPHHLSTHASPADEISKLAALRDSGALTEEEFQTSKARLVAGP